MSRSRASRKEVEAHEEAEAHEVDLTLLVANNTAGYFGVYLDKSSKSKPYIVRVR